MNSLGLINNICKDPVNRVLINQLASYLFELALKVAGYYAKDVISSAIYSNYSDLIKEIANDAVSTLFEPIDGTTEITIIHSFKSWKNPVSNDAEADYFLNKIIWNRVNQTLTKKMKDHDPVFAKIHHNLSMTVNKYGFFKTEYFGIILIVKQVPFIKQKPILDEFALQDFPSDLFLMNSHKLLEELFNQLESNKNYEIAVPLNLLVKRIKNIISGHPDITDTKLIEEIEYKLTLKEAVSIAKSDIISILDNYKAEGKITEKDLLLFETVFKKISNDLMNGGIQGSLYYYLKEQKNELNQEEFYSLYHRRFNYLYNKYMNSIKSVMYETEM